jgi:hypothetical protein
MSDWDGKALSLLMQELTAKLSDLMARGGIIGRIANYTRTLIAAELPFDTSLSAGAPKAMLAIPSVGS